MATLFVDKVDPQSGTSLELGTSGDTVSIGSGVTQTIAVNTPSFMAFLSSDQTLSDNTYTKVQFNTEDYDSDSAYDNSSNYRFTVPSGEAGKYHIFGQVRPNTSSDFEYSEAIIRLNGSDKLQTTGRNIGRDTRVIVSTLDLSVGDYIELFYYQDSGGDITVSGNSTVHRTLLGAYKLID